MTRYWSALALAIATLAGAQVDPPSPATLAKQKADAAALNWADRADIDRATRGFVGTRKDPLIKAADGRTVFDLDAFAFTRAKQTPGSVHPSLWRQAGLMARHGLFRVTDRIWQVRGFDLANITFVKGGTGWIVIDALTSTETAKAAYDLVTEKLGKRPIAAIVLTHSHADHYGGTGGLLPFAVKDVPVIAPRGFLESAISENVIAGPAMQRRATYHLGMALPRSATGLVNSGIGPAVAQGTPSLVPPTREIARTGEEVTIDGVRMLFQFTPGTEAPAEMNVGFPDWRVVDMAENANATQHNILTPRGAQIRDARRWARGLSEAIDLYAGSNVLIASHGWPRFGQAEVADYLGKHRDAYAYLHDQTVRMMNKGMTGDEIAATLKLPPVLARQWYNRPYYGSTSFNARAVYQYYLGFFDGNPAHLAPLPAEEGGRKYVAAMGGAAKVLALAQAAYDAGDYAWAAELLNRGVFADAGDAAAKTLLARCYEQLAWQSETSLWRNFYLSGAAELRRGVTPSPRAPARLGALPTAAVFDVLATRLDPAKAGTARIAFVFPERNERVLVSVANGVLTHRIGATGTADATLTVPRAAFLDSLGGGAPLADQVASGAARIEGDGALLARFAGWFDAPDPNFAIVTP
ncbi:alkyl sulfatase [Sphingomonas sp. Leaf412]|uniref:alkyl/aryl-sulfatase n=1 Tax=Sphingomonas sp. Leaf412 TaxID=1736370 RepID=UPI0006F582BF|nr:alkyl sulfatase dimerization domain-containing protein [Sphingomonas sp. Leaf412]KQT33641.1 alkyl sulfatase [Sphingomonas sp. Leaf412]